MKYISFNINFENLVLEITKVGGHLTHQSNLLEAFHQNTVAQLSFKETTCTAYLDVCLLLTQQV